MGDRRYKRHFERLLSAPDRGVALKRFETVDLVRALAAASQESDPYIANVIATELEGRLSRAVLVPHSSPRSLMRIATNGQITYANPAAERMLAGLNGNGRLPRDAPASGQADLAAPTCVGEVWTTAPWWPLEAPVHERVEHAFLDAREGQSVRFTEPMNGPDGEVRHIDVTLTPEEDATGRVLSIVAEARDVTAHVAAEDLLARRDRLARAAERLAGLGSWEYDVVRERGTASEGLDELWGIPSDPSLDLDKLLASVLPADRHIPAEAIERARTDGTPFDVNFRIAHAQSGTTRWVRAIGAAARDADGRVQRIFGAAQDITTLIEREQELARAQTLARHAERLGKFGSWERVLDAEDGVLSEGTADIYDVAPGDLRKTRAAIWRSIHEDDVARVKSVVDDAVRDGTPFDLTFRIRDRDGAIRWTRAIGESLRDAEGRQTKLVGAAQDITEQHDTVLALRASERAMKDFINAMTTFTAKLDLDGRILLMGAEAASAAAGGGADPAAFVGTKWQDSPWFTFDPVVHERVKEAFARAVSGDRVRFVSPTHGAGAILFVECTLTPTVDADGQPDFIIAEGRDVTDEQQLKNTLAAEQQRLARANADLVAFNYTVSHDLRAPIRGAQAYSRALLEDHLPDLPDEAQALLVRLNAECDRMATTINDLLALARENGREIRRGPVDVTATARAIADELQQREPERKVEFDIAPDMRADADAGLLRVLLHNLMGNAWKFTTRRPAAHIEVGVAEAVEGPTFFVRDNGIGFDSTRAYGLFEPFKRLHAHEGFEGTGIGLATVRRIVDEHGGRIWAESRPDHGATFRFTLSPPRLG